MYKNSVKIAIIDDGVSENFFNIGSLEYKMEITPDMKIIHPVNYENKIPSHGTFCAAVIRKYAPEAPLGSIKILNSRKRGVREQLVRAIEWCVNAGIKIINLSLGSVQYADSHELRETVNMAATNGIIIVCACSNQFIITYPSFFSNVIGVKTDAAHSLKEGEYIYNSHPDDGIDITCCSEFMLGEYGQETYCTGHCNSYAAPFVTAMVYNIAKENPYISIKEVKSKLMDKAINSEGKTKRPYLYKSIDWLETAVMINFNNEKRRLSDNYICFNIMNEIYLECDCFCSGAESIKKSLFKIGEDVGEFDTVIINGDNINSIHPGCSSRRFLQEITSLGKNIVYLDDREAGNYLDHLPSDYNMKIWHPSIFEYENSPLIKEINVPIITINDFTGCNHSELIAKLQGCFRMDGYNIVSASNSCLGILYGINYIPFLKLPGIPDSLKTLYRLYNPDILLYGINISYESFNYIEDKSLGMDISIIASHDYNSSVEEFMNSCRKNGSYPILLTTQRPVDRELQIKHRIKAFNMQDNDCVNEMYTYIIDLFIDKQ
jgi:hypothetical protein